VHLSGGEGCAAKRLRANPRPRTADGQIDVIISVVAEMDAAGNDFRLELYGQAHHAFDNPEVDTDPKARLVYSPAAAARSRHAIADFIREKTSL